MRNVIIIILFSLISSGCCFKLSKKLKVLNPIEYTFDRNMKSVKGQIINSLNNNQFRGMKLDQRIGEYKREILYKKGNENDFYLYSYDFIGKSMKYYSWWGPLKLDAEFHIHIDSIDENLTKIAIYTYNAEVITGFKPGIGDNLTPFVLCSKSVQASTAEEYQLLLLIGNALNQVNMPKLKKPKLF